MSERKPKLELTWIGKDDRPRLEPRILIPDITKSYHAKVRRSGDRFDNRLIFGDNLLALKALENEFTGKIKCIYIDPPFNTGAAFEHYDDGVEHSVWLNLMHSRLEILFRLLSPDGAIFVHLDDNELDYMKVTMDEIFGRSNFINRITIDARSPSAFSTVNPGVFKASEYLLWYARDRSKFQENTGKVRRNPDRAYNKWIENPDDPPESWRFSTVTEVYSLVPPPRSKRPDAVLDHFYSFIVNNARQVCRLTAISDTGAGQAIIDAKNISLKKPGQVLTVKRNGLDSVYILDGQQISFYIKNVASIDGVLCATQPLTNIWSDIAWEGIANEGNVQFKKGKKPEKLIRRCIELTTNPGDFVLDSFAGSGTTGAVAHKMGRNWIMIELGEHCHTHIIPRMQNVIDGTDQSGISQVVSWVGGGGFKYYKLAPSLIKKDAWGNDVINAEFNPEMVAEAVCKLEGFAYDPSENEFWRHGQSTESDFIYVTTQTLTVDQLARISDEVGPKRSLLVCCGAWRAKDLTPWGNLTLKKIPKAVLDKADWDRDDYSLAVSQLPLEEDEPEEAEVAKPPKKVTDNKKADQGELFVSHKKIKEKPKKKK